MAINVRCGHCGAGYKVADAMLGKWVKCGQCKQSLIVVAADAVGMGRLASPAPAAAQPQQSPITAHITPAPHHSGSLPPPPPPPAPLALPALPVAPASNGQNLDAFVDSFFDDIAGVGGPPPPPPIAAPPLAPARRSAAPAPSGRNGGHDHLPPSINHLPPTPATAAAAEFSTDDLFSDDGPTPPPVVKRKGKEKLTKGSKQKAAAAGAKSGKETFKGKAGKRGTKQQPSNNKKLVLIGGIVVAVAALAGGGFYMFGGAADTTVAAKTDGKAAKSKDSDKQKTDTEKAALDSKDAKPAPPVDVKETPGKTKPGWTADKDGSSTSFSLTGVTPKWPVALTGLQQIMQPTSPSPMVALIGADSSELWTIAGTAEGKKIGTAKIPTKTVRPLAVSPNERYPYLLVEDKSAAQPLLAVYSFQTGEKLEAFPAANFASLADFSGPQQFVTVQADTLQIWDIATKQKTSEFKLPSQPLPNSLSLSPGGKLLAFVSAEAESKVGQLLLRIMDLGKGEITGEYQLPNSEKWSLAPLATAFAPTGDELAVWAKVEPVKGAEVALRSRLIALQLPGGRERSDIKLYDQTVTPKLVGDQGRRLEYLFRQQGWLLDGKWLVDRAKKAIDWETPLPAGFDGLYSLRVVDENRLVVAWSKSNGDAKKPAQVVELETVSLPTDWNALPEKIAIKDPNPPAVAAAKPDKPDKSDKPALPVISSSFNNVKRPSDDKSSAGKAVELPAPVYDPEKANEALAYVRDKVGATFHQDFSIPEQGVDEIDFKLRDVNSAGLAKIANLLFLKKLDLTDTGVGDPGVSLLWRLPRLQTLLIGGTGISDRCFANLTDVPSLQTLDVHSTGLTSAGLKFIAKFSNLTSLDISDTSVTDLRAVQDMVNLKDLTIIRTKVSDKSLDELKRSRPELNIRQ